LVRPNLAVNSWAASFDQDLRPTRSCTTSRHSNSSDGTMQAIRVEPAARHIPRILIWSMGGGWYLLLLILLHRTILPRPSPLVPPLVDDRNGHSIQGIFQLWSGQYKAPNAPADESHEVRGARGKGEIASSKMVQPFGYCGRGFIIFIGSRCSVTLLPLL